MVALGKEVDDLWSNVAGYLEELACFREELADSSVDPSAIWQDSAQLLKQMADMEETLADQWPRIKDTWEGMAACFLQESAEISEAPEQFHGLVRNFSLNLAQWRQKVTNYRMDLAGARRELALYVQAISVERGQ